MNIPDLQTIKARQKATWESGPASARLHHGGPQGAKPKAEVIADILASIRVRRA